MAKATNGQDKIYQMITDQIIDKLNDGVIPWRKPWSYSAVSGSALNVPVNLISNKAYRGINVILLGMQGYSSPYWVSFKQAKQAGGNVRKGEKSTTVVFWKIIDKKWTEQDENGEDVQKKGKSFFLRYYRVFNTEQCENLSHKRIKEMQERAEQAEEIEEPTEEEVIETAQALIDGYSDCPPIHHGGNTASYNPGSDEINLPAKDQFNSMPEYYCTAYHEMIHSTGHKDRLDRFQFDNCLFGSTRYAKEELIAEMGACMLQALAGIHEETIDNSASYIDGWKKKLSEPDNVKWIVQAGANAQRAVDMITGIKFED